MKQGLLIMGCLMLLMGCVNIPPPVFSPTDARLRDLAIGCDQFVTESPEWREVYRRVKGNPGLDLAHDQMVEQCEQLRHMQYVKGGGS